MLFSGEKNWLWSIVGKLNGSFTENKPRRFWRVLHPSPGNTTWPDSILGKSTSCEVQSPGKAWRQTAASYCSTVASMPNPRKDGTPKEVSSPAHFSSSQWNVGRLSMATVRSDSSHRVRCVTKQLRKVAPSPLLATDVRRKPSWLSLGFDCAPKAHFWDLIPSAASGWAEWLL